MNFINLHSCPKGHKIIWDECPFCCALEKKKPTITDATFLQIFDRLKDCGSDEINAFYNNYVEPLAIPDGPGTEGSAANRFR